MKKRISKRITKFLSCTVCRTKTGMLNNSQISVNVREEYASAFRTESYIDFWTRVLELSNGQSTCIPKESTTAARLPSYRLFVENLLDPNQFTVNRILSLTCLRPIIFSLLSDYFTQTANASLLCSILLKDIDHARVKYKSLKTQSLATNKMSMSLTRLTEFTNYLNPFSSSALSSCQVRIIQSDCSKLLKKLESSRDKVKAKLQLVNKLKYGSAFCLVAITASLTLVIVTHGLVLLVAMPGLIVTSFEMDSAKKLTKVTAQLDAAAKGTYILNKDLETISRLVARLSDEVEHMCAMVKFWLVRKDNQIQASSEVAQLLNKSDCSFSDQLDELEEHLYLCFMTINRARNLVCPSPNQKGIN
ncbi:UPF0496 protein [Quillaja saponaria]|uniref:UPF0496 protein n=1 Tax=Quillaja saponaria TaxID=32244 RepID=A0AAD7VHI9_QUISA|nr:UPF0496 protein [Quillaja saponaria]